MLTDADFVFVSTFYRGKQTVNFANCVNKKEKIKNFKIWLDKPM